MTLARAPGKIILLGEHAVVYDRPAIAVPVTQVQAEARVEDGNQGITLNLPDLEQSYQLEEADPEDSLALAVRRALDYLNIGAEKGFTVTLQSDIPPGRGLGSSAAVSAALIQAVARHFDCILQPETLSDLTYDAEVLQHGTPSGVDNTVVCYGQPVYFVRSQHIELFRVGAPLHLVIADTGITSSTKEVVADVRRSWEADREEYERAFDEIGQIVKQGRVAIEAGDRQRLGMLMNQNQAFLKQLSVSSTELDKLVDAAQEAGALGAKLSGAGRGGNIVALTTAAEEQPLSAALERAGGAPVMHTVVE